MRTNIPVVSRLVRRFNALYFVDFAASGPYQDIDCNPPGQENLFDGFVLSPHKFLGGEGSCGLLMLRKSVYDLRLPPTFAGGGTVKFVGQHLHSYHDDIMEREDAGTPGALQIYQCSMAFAVKDSLGPKNIEERELDLLTDFFEWLKDTHRKNVFILGNRDPARRVAIISFNVIGPQPLHPRFVTVLLSDLFGIQSRAGCSCAGPHGVDLFGASAKHERAWASYVVGEQRGRIEEVDDIGLYSIKPGWCRINLHYTLDGDDIWYLKQALSFVVENGARFLPLYSWDAITGCWAFNPPNSFQKFLLRLATTSTSTSLGYRLPWREARGAS
jgi:selenocysteine lyase/cysteine desulfurase